MTSGRRRRRGHPAYAALVAALLSACMPSGGPVTAPGREPPRPTEQGEQGGTAGMTGAGAEAAASGPAVRAVRVVEEWDADRSAAYRAGDPVALRGLYVAGSEAGRRDVADLRAYGARGIRLVLRTLTDRLTVLVSTAHRVEVRRRARVEAVALKSGEQRALPSAPPRWQRLELVRTGEGWRLRRATEPRGSPREPP